MPLRYGPLLRPTARAVTWSPTLATGGFTVAMVALFASRNPDDPVLGVLRLAGVVLAAGAVSVLDDPTEALVDAAPTRLATRRLLRLGLWLPVMAATWAAAALLTAWIPRLNVTMPWSGLILEAATLVALGLAAASLAGAVTRGCGGAGLATTPVVLAYAWISAQLPGGAGLWADVTDPQRWTAMRPQWLTVLVTSLALLALTSRDPGGTLG